MNVTGSCADTVTNGYRQQSNPVKLNQQSFDHSNVVNLTLTARPGHNRKQNACVYFMSHVTSYIKLNLIRSHQCCYAAKQWLQTISGGRWLPFAVQLQSWFYHIGARHNIYNMQIYIYIHTYIHTYIYTHTHTRTHTLIHIHTHTHIYIYIL